MDPLGIIGQATEERMQRGDIAASSNQYEQCQSTESASVFQTGDYENGVQTTAIAISGNLYFFTSSSWAFALDGGRPACDLETSFPFDLRS